MEFQRVYVIVAIFEVHLLFNLQYNIKVYF